MSAQTAIHEHIDQLIKSNPVILFMKGTRAFPQCGFSAAVVQILDELVDEFETVNVLADGDMRSGIKTYSDWPTIPQLYVRGEFIGGSDIVRQLYASGELHKKLGVAFEEVAAPRIAVSDAAAAMLREAAVGERVQTLRLAVSPSFQYELGFAPQQEGDFVVEASGLVLFVERASAKRANGLVLHFDKLRGGFSIENPNEPPTVKAITVAELKAALEADPALRLYDVRSEDERRRGIIPGSVMLTPEVHAEAMKLPKDTPLYFSCRSGARSNRMGEEFVAAGFRFVHNVSGGILAWGRAYDPSFEPY